MAAIIKFIEIVPRYKILEITWFLLYDRKPSNVRDGGKNFLRNVDEFLPNYRVSYFLLYFLLLILSPKIITIILINITCMKYVIFRES